MRYLAFLSFMLFASPSYADHASWSQYRGGSYGPSYQYITETEGLQSTVATTTDGATDTTVYKGMGFKVAAEVELVKFARFEVYDLYRDLTNNVNDSFRGNELGGEAGLSFFGPVVNVQFGLGLFGVRELKQTDADGAVYYGSGYTASLGFERFISDKSSIMFTVKAQTENLKPELTTRPETLHVNTIGAGLALILWM